MRSVLRSALGRFRDPIRGPRSLLGEATKMKIDLGGVLVAVFVAACSAEAVDLGNDPFHSGTNSGGDGAGASSVAGGSAAAAGNSSTSVGGGGNVSLRCGDAGVGTSDVCDDGNRAS